MSDGHDLAQPSGQQPVNQAGTTQIFASDGKVLAYLHGEQNRTVISGQAISSNPKNAIGDIGRPAAGKRGTTGDCAAAWFW
jgi:membrane carboxypeptidase/penicillin-binding protein